MYVLNPCVVCRYATVIVAMGVVEGIGRQLDPDIDLLKAAAPFVIRASTKTMLGL